MQNYEKNWVRLPLENAHNVRELGGYPVQGGGQTAYHRFLRADELATLSDADVEFLLGYGVRMVIDLRSGAEAEKAPDRLLGVDGVEYVRIPFLGRNVADATQMTAEDMAQGLGGLYASMLENKEIAGEIFAAVAAAPEGCVLFHCTAGKDRTGVMAMLLMSLAGADREDCITNYAQSHMNLCRRSEFAAFDMRPELAQYASQMHSDPETMAACYDLLMEKYGSAANYLKECGLGEAQIENIRQRLVEA